MYGYLDNSLKYNKSWNFQLKKKTAMQSYNEQKRVSGYCLLAFHYHTTESVENPAMQAHLLWNIWTSLS